MNPHAPQPISLSSLVSSLWRNRQLILQMTTRDVVGRYKGSVMGVMWSFLNPLFLLCVYTFVFSVVFNTRLGAGETESKSQFAVLLFVGMVMHTLFSETLNRAPGIILGNVSYVKKIIFPLEILPVVTIGASLFHALISILIAIVAILLFMDSLHWTVVFLPLVLLPFLALTLGVAWGLASLGVFLRDIAQPVAMVMTALLFASPVFYPITALPEYIRPWLMLNPITFPIEQARLVMIFGQAPNWVGLAAYSTLAVLCAWIGYAWFQKTRKGFANVM